MNTLEVVVHQTHDLENLITHHEFSCYIDGERVNITFDPVEFVIAKPQENPRSYEIFTCSCGHAGCAGIFEGISVHKEDDKVVWVDGDSKLKHPQYEFDAARYEETVTNTLKTLFDIAAYRERYGYVEFPADHSILYFKSVSELNDLLDFIMNRGIYSDPYREVDKMDVIEQQLYFLHNRTEENFHYPDYAGLEENAFNLTSEQVDAIQYHWDSRKSMKTIEWIEAVKNRLDEIS